MSQSLNGHPTDPRSSELTIQLLDLEKELMLGCLDPQLL
jgi:hypothetical protein